MFRVLFVSLFISLTKIGSCRFQTDYVISCEFSNANGWVDEVEFKVKAGAGLGGHAAHWPSGWEVCTGYPAGTSCISDIQPVKFYEQCISFAVEVGIGIYQIFNLTSFPNNVSHLQLKLGLESAATVTYSSPQVVPSHSLPPSFVQAHPCLESQAMQPLHDPHSMSLLMVTVRSKQCQHGNVSLATDDDRFRPSGHLKLELPYIMDEWSDGEHSFLSFQIA